MTELKGGMCSENEEVEEYKEYKETKAPQEKDYSIYKEHNGKVIKLLFGDETDLKKEERYQISLTENEPWRNNWRHKTNF